MSVPYVQNVAMTVDDKSVLLFVGTRATHMFKVYELVIENDHIVEVNKLLVHKFTRDVKGGVYGLWLNAQLLVGNASGQVMLLTLAKL